MDEFGPFRNELSNALHHLSAPDYQAGEALCAVLGCDPGSAPAVVQLTLAEAIRALQPAPVAPAGGRSRQEYDVLHHRFVLRLTQEQTAEALSLSVRSVQRIQREAIHELAKRLWERQLPAGGAGPPASSDSATGDWHAQAELELASLRRSDPNSAADVAQALQGLQELGSALTSNPAVRLQVAHVQPGLVALAHPTALRQMLIAAIARLARTMASGDIRVYAVLDDGSVKITLTAPVGVESGARPKAGDLTRDILAPAGSSVEASVEHGHIYLYLRLPSTGEVTVLAVDDNPDMLHFYRRCAAGTPYRVIHATSGREAQERIKANPPDILVLDVMLPDVDGWKLLMQWHEDPATRAIPVIICSVVREEELAYSLGATHYLMKPFRPQQFAEALNRARQAAHPVAHRPAPAE
jgi:CheY-like chemotaxis protein